MPDYEAQCRNARHQIVSCEAEITQRNAAISAVEEKIERLEEVKKELKKQKNNARDEQDEIRSEYASHISGWEGKNKESFCSDMTGELLVNYESFYTAIDAALDSVHDRITMLENEKYEQEGLVGLLRSKINSFWNVVEKYMN